MCLRSQKAEQVGKRKQALCEAGSLKESTLETANVLTRELDGPFQTSGIFILLRRTLSFQFINVFLIDFDIKHNTHTHTFRNLTCI
jgi:hypothetical protein